MKLAIVGCGYFGERLLRLCLGLGLPRPVATTRNPARARELARWGADVRVVDPCDAAALGEALQGADAVIHSIPAAPGPTAAIVNAACAAPTPVLVYIGSTAVYPRHAGDVDEETPVAPEGPGAARLADETVLTEAARTRGVRVGLLRVAAIYGPGRGLHVRIRTGIHRVPGDGGNFVSRIHVDDLAQIALACAQRLAGDPAGTTRLYCVADEQPTTAREHADGVAQVLGLPPPDAMPADQAPETLRGSRRVSSARLRRELSVQLRYPTWREGLAQCLAEEAASIPPPG